MAQPLPVHDDLSDFAAAVRTGLAQPQKVIPARFFYDHAGSELFQAITALPEYYPTRTEIGILTEQAPPCRYRIWLGQFGQDTIVAACHCARGLCAGRYFG